LFFQEGSNEKMNRTIVCTAIASNYLPKAKVLARSLKRTNPNIDVIICLVEKEMNPEAKLCKYFDHVILAKDLGFENFDNFIFKYKLVEASTAVKGQLFKYLMNEYKKFDQFVYLDPDIFVLGSLDELQTAFDKHSIILTPHLLEPEEDDHAIWDNEICTLRYGVFNLGFLALKRSAETDRFLDWWSKRLEFYCYDNLAVGLFTDQKWINLAPAFFEDICILKHPGYNVAPWNLSRRTVTLNDINQYKVNDDPLIFFHFSGFDSGANAVMLNKYAPGPNNAVQILRQEYMRELNEMGQSHLGKTSWSYNYFLSGERITDTARYFYRNNRNSQENVSSPFDKSNEFFLSQR
jgi:lipopolysaccharide biosynthesis glycosyltransferase